MLFCAFNGAVCNQFNQLLYILDVQINSMPLFLYNKTFFCVNIGFRDRC